MISDIFSFVDLDECEEITFAGRFIYFLLDDNRVVYVGQTTSLANRVGAHLLDGEKIFNSVKFKIVSIDVKLTDAEFFQILAHKPKYNITLPTPSFFIVVSKLMEMIENDKVFGCGETATKYNAEIPEYQIGIGSKVFNYWLNREFIDFKEDIDRCLAVSECDARPQMLINLGEE